VVFEKQKIDRNLLAMSNECGPIRPRAPER